VDRVVLKLRSSGARVHISGLNEASTALLARLATHNQPDAELAIGH
jgi:SulP family sulfate permease